MLLTRVLYRKQNVNKEFVVVDAAMNDLIRPSLYHSHHDILPLRKTDRPEIVADVVGPICETGDFLARDRKLANVAPGDYLAIATAGAYGFVLVFQLQRPPPTAGDPGGWRKMAHHSCPRELRRTGARRNGLTADLFGSFLRIIGKY